jgi:aminopeptidase N
MPRTATVALSFLVASGFMQHSPSSQSPAPNSELPTPHGQPAAATDGLAQAGVPLSLARERAARISNLTYELDLTIPDTVSQRVTGRVVVSFDLKDPSTPLALDFGGPAGGVKATTVNGVRMSLPWVEEHIVAPASSLRAGPNAVAIEFHSADAPLNRNAEFMYALFVPARARQAFPCFDQPDLKGKYTVSLDVPAGWEALANGVMAGKPADSPNGRRIVRFAETKPISTYLFTFAAGRFTVETAERAGRTFRMLHRETDGAKVARNRDAIFDLHAGAIAWLEKYTAIAYPFDKFDFLLVPAFQFGGMEHPGAVYYKASSLLLDPSATQEERLGRASLISHETAHMWFGDLVTMQWFNDVWTKEVFANFMAAKIVAPAFPEVDHDLRFLYAHYPGAYDVDRTEGSNAIRQELANLNEAGSLYGAIIYQKAPIVMRQLELIVGADAFRDGLREYLKAHAFGNATWHDLVAVLDPRTAEDLVKWSHAWVEESGRPTITTVIEKDGTTLRRVSFTQHDPVPGRGLVWSQPLPELAAGSPVPPYILPNAGGVAYGNFVLDTESRAYLLGHLWELEPAVLRGSALITLWEEMLDGRVGPAAMMDLLLRCVAKERDELNVGRMLSYTRQAYWKFIGADQRGAFAARLEQVLRAGLKNAQSASLKSAWFNGLRDTASTPSSLQLLERVWRKQEEIPGLTLAEPDYITLAQSLAVRGVAAAEEILDAQIARTENPDRKAQMTFVRPALSRDQKTRDAFFASLSDVNNRRRETWVLEAVGYLHHPLRAASSEKYIEPSLKLVRDIQRTGDIFFPKRWADATLSGHTSATAAKTVRRFVAALPPDYPDRLRRVVLSSADDLFRASRN